MKRTQLYLEEHVWKLLEIRARQGGTTISELVRQAVREKYWNKPANRAQILQSALGIWKHRKDIGDSTEYVRKLRKGSRLKRFGL
jgi:hypothetical protein